MDCEIDCLSTYLNYFKLCTRKQKTKTKEKKQKREIDYDNLHLFALRSVENLNITSSVADPDDIGPDFQIGPRSESCALYKFLTLSVFR
jgi:hypothetical protein